MAILVQIEAVVRAASDAYREAASDRYDFWQEHVRYVYAEALRLADRDGADREIVALAAMLHDIALIRQVGKRRDHHEVGANLAAELLREHGYAECSISRVAECIRAHRSSRHAATVEALCVADADILAHFDNIPMCLGNAIRRANGDLAAARIWLRDAFARDYADLSDRTRADFADRYAAICAVVFGED